MKVLKNILLSTIFIITANACSREPYVDTLTVIGLGVVIGKDDCTGNILTDYVVIALNHPGNTWHEGDTLFVNGIQYTNVVKVAVQNPADHVLRTIGQKVAFKFEKQLPSQNNPSCTAPNAIINPVKIVKSSDGVLGSLRG
jgi:hypothetical protein